MLLRDLTCCNCHKDYDVVDMGTVFLIKKLDENHRVVEENENDELLCPYCNSPSYEERYIDDIWNEE